MVTPRIKIVFILLLLLNLSWSCSGNRLSTQIPSIDSIYVKLNQRSIEINALSGELKVELWEESERVKLRQLFMSQAPQQLRIDTLSPFEQPLAIFALNQSTLSIYDAQRKAFFRGIATPNHFERFSRLKIDPKDLSLLLRGQTPLFNDPQGQIKWDHSKNATMLEERRGTVMQKVWFDEQLRATELQRIDKKGGLLRIQFANYTDEPAIPKRIRIELPQSQVRADLKVSELIINPKLSHDSFILTPPAGVLIRPLD